MKAAKELKKYLEKITKRGDLNIVSCEIRDKVDRETLKGFKGKIPDDLLSFYSVMNGCYLLSSFANNSSLEVGINIPPIEDLGEFETASEEYNFDEGLKILLFEWIEGQYSPFFYCLPDDETNLEKAKIITAVSAREDEYTVIADNLAFWIELAIENGLALGWGNPTIYKEEIKKIKALFDAPPEKRRVLLPGTRVSTKQGAIHRGKVIRQYMSKEKDIYGRQDFTLVEFDIGETYWMDSGDLKIISSKKDYYESLIINPKESLIALSNMKAEDSIVSLAKIAMSQDQYFGFGIDHETLPSCPCDSIRFVQLFTTLTLEESSEIILTVCNNWIENVTDNYTEMQPLNVDGSEYHKKDDHIVEKNYSYEYMLENLLGCLIYLIARERYMLKEDFSYADEQKKKLSITLEKLMGIHEEQNAQNKLYPEPDRIENLYTSDNIILGQVHTIEDWQTKMGISDYPYIVCL